MLQGYSSSYFGNLLLLAYFVTKQEREAALIQAIGVASNAAVLAQVHLLNHISDCDQLMPPASCCILIVVLVSAIHKAFLMT